jgi:hypothetical protein
MCETADYVATTRTKGPNFVATKRDPVEGIIFVGGSVRAKETIEGTKSTATIR